MNNDSQKIDEYLESLRDKIKISPRTGNAYLPISVVYSTGKSKDNESLKDNSHNTWIFGAYTEDGFNIQCEMNETLTYGHLNWNNTTVLLDKDFNVENYTEHIIECPRCHQQYSDIYSNHAPDKSKREDCTLCRFYGYKSCNKDKTCKYNYKEEIECNECLFNGGVLDPRTDINENKDRINTVSSFIDRNS